MSKNNTNTIARNAETNNLINTIIHDTLAPYVTPVRATAAPKTTVVDITADEETDVAVPVTNSTDSTDTANNTNIANGTNSVSQNVMGVHNTADADTVVNKLKELGLLPTIKKLINKADLQTEDIERAAVSIHMLTDGLTEEQAVVVNDFDNKGIDLMQYVTPEYTPIQMFYIGTQLETEQSVTAILNPKYTVLQMIELQKATNVCKIDVSVYANAELSPAQLRILRKAYTLGVDIETLATHAVEYTWEQLDCLVALSFEGVDVSKLLTEHNAEELTVDYLREMLKQLVDAQDSVTLVLSEDSKQIIKPRED